MNNPKVPFIAVSGNIGAGKSALTELLARRLGWEPIWEPVTTNPYLSDFYQDMERWGFHSQIFFLIVRMGQHYRASNLGKPIIQDRTVYEDAEVFARNLYLMGLIKERDWITYNYLYEIAREMLRPPDLIIYLKASIDTLQKRIQQRTRSFEQGISREYLESLEQKYKEWKDTFDLSPFLVVDTEQVDFVHTNKGKEIVFQMLERRLRDLA